jgi:hypothetical protein
VDNAVMEEKHIVLIDKFVAGMSSGSTGNWRCAWAGRIIRWANCVPKPCCKPSARRWIISSC